MKFDGILLCTDLDDTLLKDDKSVSKENMKAIEYFKNNGGTFTFITGRTFRGAKHIIEKINPNAPIGCLNGGSIYDHKNKKNLMEIELDKSAAEVIDLVIAQFPSLGVEVVTHEHNYFCKRNFRTDEHQRLEFLPDKSGDYHTIQGKWAKILLIDEKNVIDKLIPYIHTLKPSKRFEFVRSTDYYYEILPPAASKGNLLKELAKLTGANKTVAVGDNENDVSMIAEAQLGIAVANAVQKAKDAANFVTVSNMEHAIAQIICNLDNGIM